MHGNEWFWCFWENTLHSPPHPWTLGILIMSFKYTGAVRHIGAAASGENLANVGGTTITIASALAILRSNFPGLAGYAAQACSALAGWGHQVYNTGMIMAQWCSATISEFASWAFEGVCTHGPTILSNTACALEAVLTCALFAGMFALVLLCLWDQICEAQRHAREEQRRREALQAIHRTARRAPSGTSCQEFCRMTHQDRLNFTMRFLARHHDVSVGAADQMREGEACSICFNDSPLIVCENGHGVCATCDLAWKSADVMREAERLMPSRSPEPCDSYLIRVWNRVSTSHTCPVCRGNFARDDSGNRVCVVQ